MTSVLQHGADTPTAAAGKLRQAARRDLIPWVSWTGSTQRVPYPAPHKYRSLVALPQEAFRVIKVFLETPAELRIAPNSAWNSEDLPDGFSHGLLREDQKGEHDSDIERQCPPPSSAGCGGTQTHHRATCPAGSQSNRSQQQWRDCCHVIVVIARA